MMSELARISITLADVFGRDAQGRSITAGAVLKNPSLIAQIVPSTLTKSAMGLFASLIKAVRVKYVFKGG